MIRIGSIVEVGDYHKGLSGEQGKVIGIRSDTVDTHRGSLLEVKLDRVPNKTFIFFTTELVEVRDERGTPRVSAV